MSALSYWNMDRGAFQSQMQTSRVFARIPTETNCPASDCGWDEHNQSAKKVDCLICGGEGKLTTWVNYNVLARVLWTGMLRYVYQQPTTGVELGDCILTVSREWLPLIEQVFNNERAYIGVDDKNVRPKTLQSNTLPGIIEEYEFVCYVFTPK